MHLAQHYITTFISVKDGFCRSAEPHRKGLYTKYKPVSFEECKAKCGYANFCTAIEYHHDTERCELHYWDIVEVDPVSSSRREGKVKCYTVCKSSSCHVVDDRLCYSKFGDGACYGIGNGQTADGNSAGACYVSCNDTPGCSTYEFDYRKKRCKIFLNDLEPKSVDSSQKGKVCFKYGCNN